MKRFAVCIMALFAWANASMSMSGEVAVFPVPSGLTPSPDLQLTANGKDIFVERYGNQKDRIDVAQFEGTGEIRLMVTAGKDIGNVVIRPKSRGTKAQVKGNTLTFKANITIRKCIMAGWAHSDGVTIGFELETPTVSDILVQDCDILYARGGGASGGHSGFSITCDGPARVKDIVFDNIRLEDGVQTKAFEIIITEGTKYGRSKKGEIGHVKGITMKNCHWEREDRPFVIKGYDAEHLVEDVRFENCTVAGKPLTRKEDALFQVSPHTRNIEFSFGQ